MEVGHAFDGMEGIEPKRRGLDDAIRCQWWYTGGQFGCWRLSTRMYLRPDGT